MSNKKTKNNVKKPSKKKVRILPVAVMTIIAILVVGFLGYLIFSTTSDSAKLSELCDYQWISSSAVNSSGDEIPLAEVYNTNYSSYQGTLNFKDDYTFSLWLSPGSIEDGTHTGIYEIVDDSKIDVIFNDTTYTSFYIHREDGEISSISLNYEDYEVFFTKA